MSVERKPEIPDDGLAVDDVGEWSLDKHKLVGGYAHSFSTGMKNRWQERAYLDLYSGPGHARVRGTSRIVETSPLLALRVPDPFTRHVSCDKDAHLTGALRKRASRVFPDRDVRYHTGDCSQLTRELRADIPAHGKGKKVLSLAFLDPRSIGTLKCATIDALSTHYMDFIVLLALSLRRSPGSGDAV